METQQITVVEAFELLKGLLKDLLNTNQICEDDYDSFSHQAFVNAVKENAVYFQNLFDDTEKFSHYKVI